jgi:hypothetical protein
MSPELREPVRSRPLATVFIVLAVLALAFLLGQQASILWFGLLAAGLGAAVLLARPVLVLPALVLTALVVPIELGTGTDVKLNLVTLLVPTAGVLWLFVMLGRRDVRLAPSRTNLPLFLLLAAGLLSMGIGTVFWDPLVPRPANFTLVQLAQWSIFAFSALAFWLTAGLVENEAGLWRLTAVFMVIGGGLAIARLLPGLGSVIGRLSTVAFIRAPFWVLLAALVGGQLAYNRTLPTPWRLFLLAALLGVIMYAFVHQRDSVSNWVGVGAVAATLIWLRFRRLRWPLLLVVAVLAFAGLLFPAIYNFAGGEREWTLSGGPRLALGQRVIELTLRNPITGLGPAAYRPYGFTGSLKYGHVFYQSIALSAHNNFVDIFSQMGLLGLALFAWFMAEVTRVGLRLRKRYASGFAAGYVNGMLAAGVGALAIMMLADWILPFVYNIGFPGFQASVLVWLFLGGLVALDRMGDTETRREGDAERGRRGDTETRRQGDGETR